MTSLTVALLVGLLALGAARKAKTVDQTLDPAIPPPPPLPDGLVPPPPPPGMHPPNMAAAAHAIGHLKSAAKAATAMAPNRRANNIGRGKANAEDIHAAAKKGHLFVQLDEPEDYPMTAKSLCFQVTVPVMAGTSLQVGGTFNWGEGQPREEGGKSIQLIEVGGQVNLGVTFGLTLFGKLSLTVSIYLSGDLQLSSRNVFEGVDAAHSEGQSKHWRLIKAWWNGFYAKTAFNSPEFNAELFRRMVHDRAGLASEVEANKEREAMMQILRWQWEEMPVALPAPWDHPMYSVAKVWNALWETVMMEFVIKDLGTIAERKFPRKFTIDGKEEKTMWADGHSFGPKDTKCGRFERQKTCDKRLAEGEPLEEKASFRDALARAKSAQTVGQVFIAWARRALSVAPALIMFGIGLDDDNVKKHTFDKLMHLDASNPKDRKHFWDLLHDWETKVGWKVDMDVCEEVPLDAMLTFPEKKQNSAAWRTYEVEGNLVTNARFLCSLGKIAAELDGAEYKPAIDKHKHIGVEGHRADGQPRPLFRRRWCAVDREKCLENSQDGHHMAYCTSCKCAPDERRCKKGDDSCEHCAPDNTPKQPLPPLDRYLFSDPALQPLFDTQALSAAPFSFTTNSQKLKTFSPCTIDCAYVVDEESCNSYIWKAVKTDPKPICQWADGKCGETDQRQVLQETVCPELIARTLPRRGVAYKVDPDATPPGGTQGFAVPLWSATMMPVLTQRVIDTNRAVMEHIMHDDAAKAREAVGTFWDSLPRLGASQTAEQDALARTIDEDFNEVFGVREEASLKLQHSQYAKRQPGVLSCQGKADNDCKPTDGCKWGEEAQECKKLRCTDALIRTQETCDTVPGCIWDEKEATMQVDENGLERKMGCSTATQPLYADALTGKAYHRIDEYRKEVEKWKKKNANQLAKAYEALEYKEVIDWEASIAVGMTSGEAAVGYCTPDTNMFQAVLPVVAYSGTMDPMVNSEDRNTGKAVGFSLLYHPNPLFSLTYTGTYDRVAKEYTHGFEFLLYLLTSTSNIGSGEASITLPGASAAGAFESDAGKAAIAVVTQLAHVFAGGDHIVPVQDEDESTESAMEKVKKYLGTLWKGVKAVASFAKMVAKQGDGPGDFLKQAVSGGLLGNQQAYMMLVIKTELKAGQPIRFTAELDTLAIQQWTPPFLAAVGAGLEIDVCSGQARDASAVFNKVLPNIKEDVPENPAVKSVPEQNPRCQHCTRVMELAMDNEDCGKTAACKPLDDAEQKAICASVVDGIEDFFNTNHKHGFMRKAVKTHEEFQHRKDELNSEICGADAAGRCEKWKGEGKGAGCGQSCEGQTATPRGLCLYMGVSCMDQKMMQDLHAISPSGQNDRAALMNDLKSSLAGGTANFFANLRKNKKHKQHE